MLLVPDRVYSYGPAGEQVIRAMLDNLFPPRSCACDTIHDGISHVDFMDQVVVPETTRLLIREDMPDVIDSRAVLEASRELGARAHLALEDDDFDRWFKNNVG